MPYLELLPMQDTPQHIKDLQLKTWLSKPPMERLRQFLVDNDDFYKMVAHMKESMDKSKTSGQVEATRNEQ